MPSEIRFILFEVNEVATALRDFLIERQELGAGDQLAVTAVHDRPAVTVELALQTGTACSQRAVGGAQLAAAMIMFCVRRGIPVPHRAQKTLKRVGSALALSFSQGMGPADFDLVMRREQLVDA